MTLVSVIIPTYKRSLRLPQAIKSVLDQSYKKVEIIVVDDNGDNEHREETKKILAPFLKEHAIRYLCHEINKGGCSARNTGAFAANGEYLTFLDDDDFYEPQKIEKQVELLEKNKYLDACMCDMFRMDENKNQIISRENTARGLTLKEAIMDGNLFTSMLMIKKEVFIKLGGFSEIPRFQDQYFHYKFLEQGYQIGALNKPLLTLVEHNDVRISLTATHKIIDALNILHRFEIKHQPLFDKKEWRFIKHRIFYDKAYALSQGNAKNRVSALCHIVKSLPYYNGEPKIFRLGVKCLLPKALFKK